MTRICALLLGTVGLLCGCGSGSGDSSTIVGDSPRDSFTVTVAADEQGTGKQAWTLTCRPTGGDHPDAAAACDAIAAIADPFGPVPRDMACTEIYGGPAVATIVGTSGGRSIDARYTRTNGCEISRWDALAAVFPGVESGQPGTGAPQ